MKRSPLVLPLAASATIAVGIALYSFWSHAESERKTEQLRALPGTKIDVVVTLAFAPDFFHMSRAQQLGQVVKTEGEKLYLRGATLKDIQDLARAYWVVGVEPWQQTPR